MKRILSVCLLLLLLACAGAAAEEIILNKTRGDHADFAFSQDAQLLEVYFPQIFGCDAALVRYGDYSLLIDCAGNQWKQTKALLDKLGVTALTYALNSHPDADHIGGFNHVLKDIPAGEFLLGFPEDHDSGDEVRFKVYEDLHAMGIPLRRVQHGDTIEFGDVQITVYQRTDEHLPRVNNKSVMLMIQYGERRIFFTGDIQSHAQKILGENAEGLNLDCDILKFPHHGYDRMQESFLAQAAPELVICTCGDSKTEGIKQLKEHKIPYLMTANQLLRLATDGKVWTVERVK
ncbi:MAG: MBL fold metallo-hydrolase [Clostridia bacterium]|nr:MBL fold metallo-hydrolase [Clostridia bacterium]